MCKRTALANRHIAKLLDNLERLVDMTPLAKTAVMQQLHWLAEDVETASKQGESHERIHEASS
jgi:hypothetical protein